MNPKIFRSILLFSSLAFIFAGCKTRNNQPIVQEPVPVPPAEYGEGAPGEGGIPMPPEQEGGRFGYSGADGNVPPAPPAPPKPADPSRPGVRDVRDMKPSDTASAPTAPPEKKEEKKAPAPTEMPYANPVPGNPLVVTLPGSNASLGKISIEKYDSSMNPTGEPLKRGTQVQIPDPNNPGKKIKFKVP